MLLNPGAVFDYNGGRYSYPDVRLVYWAGGNPFHHHQDLNRLQQAWQRPDTVILHDWCWNATAKRADIVLPCTTMLERTDIGMTPRDPYVIAMTKSMEPCGEARDDYDILAGIARAMGCEEQFCEGRSGEEWVRHLWDQSRRRAASSGVDLPPYEDLVAAEYHRNDTPPDEPVLFSAFRVDPNANPLATPSGKIELFSERVASLGYADCHGHATWNEPDEWLGNATAAHPLHLLGKQPRNKLHSQLDPSGHSSRAKVGGHEAVEINPQDAARRGINDGDIVRISNDRGSCLGGAVITAGQLLRGSQNFGGDMGHLLAVPGGPVCSCGKRGCLNTVASGWAVMHKLGTTSRSYETVNQFRTQNSQLRLLLDDGNAEAEAVEQAMKEAGAALAKHTMTTLQALNPEAVCLTGPLGRHDTYSQAFRDSLTAMGFESRIILASETEIITPAMASVYLALSDMVYSPNFNFNRISHLDQAKAASR